MSSVEAPSSVPAENGAATPAAPAASNATHADSNNDGARMSDTAADSSGEAKESSSNDDSADEILLDSAATPDLAPPFSTPSTAVSGPVNDGDGCVFDGSLKSLSENSLVELLEGLETLLVYTKNLIVHPHEKKYRKIKLTNIHYQERLGHLPGALEAMNCIGYVEQGEYLRLDESRVGSADSEARLIKVEKAIVAKLNELKKQWAQMPARAEPNQEFSSVHAVGCHSAIGKRHNMEDDEIMIDRFCGDAKQGFFGLYDGHGGRATVDFVVKALHMNMEQHLKRHPDSDLASAFKHSYLTTDGQLRRQSILRSGSTSVTCVVRMVGDKRMLFTANVGDSRAVLSRNKQAIRLTIDHKASLAEEAKRIREAGGFIGRNKRVNGVLAISRALGDHMLKNCGGGLNDVVSAEPFCSETELTPEDSYILLACDGLFDVCSDQEAIDFLEEKVLEFATQMATAKLKGSSSSEPAADVDMAPQEEEKAKTDDAAPASSTSSTDAPSSSPNSPSAADAASSSSSSSSSPPVSLSCLTPADWNEVLTQTSKALVREALDRRSLDNVTVLIIKL